MEQRFSRQQLYELVWSQPIRDVAATLNISDVALAKTCRKANIPVPPRGYWARKQAGQAVVKPPLPLRFPGSSDVIGSERRSYSWNGNWREQILAEPIPPVPVFEESLEALGKRVRKITGIVKMYTSFQRVHPLISKLLAQDEERAAEYAKYKSAYNAPRYATGVGQRKLLILNALFLHLQGLGCGISMTTSRYAEENRDIHFRVGNQGIAAKLDICSGTEKPSGKLRFEFNETHGEKARNVWEETANSNLDKKLDGIVAKILISAELGYREAATRNRKWQIERKAQIEQELIEIREQEARKAHEAILAEQRGQVRNLLSQAAQLQRSNQIRAYVKAVRGMSLVVTPERLDHWASWALSEADRIDPSKNGNIALSINGLIT